MRAAIDASSYVLDCMVEMRLSSRDIMRNFSKLMSPSTVESLASYMNARSFMTKGKNGNTGGACSPLKDCIEINNNDIAKYREHLKNKIAVFI